MSEEETSIAVYRELPIVDPTVIETTRSMASGGVVHTDRPVQEQWLTDPIPDLKKRWREDGGFYYVDIEYVEERLNNAYGPGRWSFVPVMVRTFEGKTEKGDPKTEIFVEGRLYAPGVVDVGIVGVGTGMYFPKSPRATYSNAYATAISEATKNAAKKMGIGLDIKDRDAQKLEQAQDTLAKMVEQLSTDAASKEKIFEALELLVPQAVSGGEFKAWLVDEVSIDKVTKEVLRVARGK